ncbi:10865_t:CDS:2 [Entrophospora sp. SA101]|nr:10865_t:CDS:2 [Entrophospora sp. SA101]
MQQFFIPEGFSLRRPNNSLNANNLKKQRPHPYHPNVHHHNNSSPNRQSQPPPQLQQNLITDYTIARKSSTIKGILNHPSKTINDLWNNENEMTRKQYHHVSFGGVCLNRGSGSSDSSSSESEDYKSIRVENIYEEEDDDTTDSPINSSALSSSPILQYQHKNLNYEVESNDNDADDNLSDYSDSYWVTNPDEEVYLTDEDENDENS